MDILKTLSSNFFPDMVYPLEMISFRNVHIHVWTGTCNKITRCQWFKPLNFIDLHISLSENLDTGYNGAEGGGGGGVHGYTQEEGGIESGFKVE